MPKTYINEQTFSQQCRPEPTIYFTFFFKYIDIYSWCSYLQVCSAWLTIWRHKQTIGRMFHIYIYPLGPEFYSPIWVTWRFCELVGTFAHLRALKGIEIYALHRKRIGSISDVAQPVDSPPYSSRSTRTPLLKFFCEINPILFLLYYHAVRQQDCTSVHLLHNPVHHWFIKEKYGQVIKHGYQLKIFCTCQNRVSR